jgi:hypothetical protein
MIALIKKPFAALRRFFDRETGSISIEAVIMLPALAWCYLGTYVFFDAYRSQSINTKVAYTIGDTLSRETNFITPAFIDGMHELQAFLVDSDHDIALRISVFTYDGDADRYEVIWSEGRGGPITLDDDALNLNRAGVPLMANADVAILVETWVDYVPDYTVGITEFTFRDFVVTRPRFATQLCWNPIEDGDFTTAVC